MFSVASGPARLHFALGATHMRQKAAIKVVIGLLAGLFGVVSLLSAGWPSRRKVLIQPGTSVEVTTVSSQFWVCLFIAVALLLSSAYLFRLAYREFRNEKA